MNARPTWEPPRLYSWTVVAPNPDGPGAVGITDDLQLAKEHAEEALLGAPDGSRAAIYRATPSAVRIAFQYDGLIAKASLDSAAGEVVWDYVSASLESVFQGVPPEGIAAGRYDVVKESRRRRALGIAIDAPEVPRR